MNQSTIDKLQSAFNDSIQSQDITLIANALETLNKAKQEFESNQYNPSDLLVLQSSNVDDETIRIESNYNPKDSLRSGYQATQKSKREYLKIVEWARYNKFERDSKDPNKNVWIQLAKKYVKEGWPLNDDGIPVSSDTAKKLLGRDYIPAREITCFKAFLSGQGYIAGLWTKKPLPMPMFQANITIPENPFKLDAKVEQKEVVNGKVVNVLQDLVDKNTEKVQNDKIKLISSMTRDINPPLGNLPVKVSQLSANQADILTKEVLFGIIQGGAKRSDKAKRLAIELMFELGLTN